LAYCHSIKGTADGRDDGQGKGRGEGRRGLCYREHPHAGRGQDGQGQGHAEDVADRVDKGAHKVSEAAKGVKDSLKK
jgi:hypothetical protein